MSKITTTQGNLKERSHSTQCKDKTIISNVVIQWIKFDLATNDTNIDFSVSGIPEETVKRFETLNILQLIRRITRHPQKQAVQNDLDQKQSFNAFSAESKKAIKESGNIEISEIVNTEPKWQCKFCLNHCNPGVIYCVCGRLMTDGFRLRIESICSSTLDSFSIANFYIQKRKTTWSQIWKSSRMQRIPHGTSTCKEMSQKGIRKHLRQVHASTRPFRSAMIEHSRTETSDPRDGQACD